MNSPKSSSFEVRDVCAIGAISNERFGEIPSVKDGSSFCPVNVVLSVDLVALHGEVSKTDC